MNLLEKTVLWLSILLITITTIYFSIHFKNHYRGVYFLKAKKFDKAKQMFLNTLAHKPNLFSVRLNLALVESLQDNVNGAINEYTIVGEKSNNHNNRFQAYFNSAILKYFKQDVDDSLSFYQKALKENSLSKEVKTNIELMMAQQQQKAKPKKEDNKNQKQQADQKNPPEEDKNKESESQDSQEEQEKSSDQKNFEDTEMGEENKQDEKELSQKQIQFIFKELENREKNLKFRLNKDSKQRQQGKTW